MDSKQVATSLMEVVLKHHVNVPRKSIMAYMNAAGLALTALPESFLKALDEEIVKMLKHPFLKDVSAWTEMVGAFGGLYSETRQ